MTTYRLVFLGDPVAKGRPRFTRRGHAYTPAKTRLYETQLAIDARRQWGKAGLLTGALQVEAFFYLRRPKLRVERTYPTVRPDADNYLKAATDALNEIVWKDDSQIVKVSAEKLYDEQGQPRTVLYITEL